MTAAEIIQQVTLDVRQSARKLDYVAEYLSQLDSPAFQRLIPLLKKHADDLNKALDEV